MKTAIKITRKKKEKARYYYILAQIYQYYKQKKGAAFCVKNRSTKNLAWIFYFS